MCRDYLSFSYYPVWNGLLDLFATDNDVYMHSLTRLQWVNNIVYDIENNLISSDVSVNTYSALVSLGETQLASLILDALKGCISPTSCRLPQSPSIIFIQHSVEETAQVLTCFQHYTSSQGLFSRGS